MLKTRNVTAIASTFALALIVTGAAAQSPSRQSPEPSVGFQETKPTTRSSRKVRQTRPAALMTVHETTPIIGILEVVTGNSGKQFLLDYRVPEGVVVGPAGYADLDYEAFLRVLDNNDLAAVTTGDYVTIVPKHAIRQAEMPVLQPGQTAAAGEWVTRVFVLKHVPAPQLVPILRPLMPNSAHLAAQSNANALLVVDRYANTERVREVIAAMDVPSARQ